MWQNIQMHINPKWHRCLNAVRVVFVMHLNDIKLHEKKDNQVSGAGPAKSSGVSGTNSGYPPRKDCICR